MSDEKKEPWMNYLALTTVIFAVCATLSTFKGSSFSTKSVISQAQASDQWAYFQAKSIKESIYRVQKENLVFEKSTLPPSSKADIVKRFDDAIKNTEEKIVVYDKEKNGIMKDAKDLELKRDSFQKHGQPFGIGVIFFQVAILLSSVAGLFKKKIIWYLAMPIGGIGFVYFLNGFFLFF